MSERAGLATKTLSHEAARRKTLWSFVSWCLSGEILLNTPLPHYLRLRKLIGGTFVVDLFRTKEGFKLLYAIALGFELCETLFKQQTVMVKSLTLQRAY